MKKLLPFIGLLIILLPACQVSRTIAVVKSGGLDSAILGTKTNPVEYIRSNETFLSYNKSGSLQIVPSRVIEFRLHESEKIRKEKYRKEKIKREKIKRVKGESHWERRARLRKERTDWKAGHPHETCRQKKERRKKEIADWKASHPHVSCHEKHAQRKRERYERKHQAKPEKISCKEKHRRAKAARQAAKQDRLRNAMKQQPTSYAYANLNKYYYRYLPGNGVADFFLAMFAIVVPNTLAMLPPVHEKKEYTDQLCKYDKHCEGIAYDRKILLETDMTCRRDQIGEPIHVWEDLPAEITMNSYKVKLRGGKKQIESVTHTTANKNGKVYHDFVITPRNGAFTRFSRVWIIMNVSVTPLPEVRNEIQPVQKIISKPETPVTTTPVQVIVPVAKAAPVAQPVIRSEERPVQSNLDTAIKSAPVSAVQSPPAVAISETAKKAEPVKQSDNADDSIGISFHKVVAGETIESIVQHYGITMAEFNKWNYLPDGVSPGINVVVKFNLPKKKAQVKEAGMKAPEVKSVDVKKPSPEAKTDDTGIKYHIVVSGETLYHLSVVYHVTVQQIKDWNKLSSNTVSVGQKLVVGK